jgi:hypothetical protein
MGARDSAGGKEDQGGEEVFHIISTLRLLKSCEESSCNGRDIIMLFMVPTFV